MINIATSKPHIDLALKLMGKLHKGYEPKNLNTHRVKDYLQVHRGKTCSTIKYTSKPIQPQGFSTISVRRHCNTQIQNYSDRKL